MDVAKERRLKQVEGAMVVQGMRFLAALGTLNALGDQLRASTDVLPALADVCQLAQKATGLTGNVTKPLVELVVLAAERDSLMREDETEEPDNGVDDNVCAEQPGTQPDVQP